MTKFILYISAFVPMYVLFLLNLIIEIINKNLTLNITNTCVLIVLIFLTIVGVSGLIIIIDNKGTESEIVTIISKKNLTDQHFLNYFSLFVLLALAFDLSKICFVAVFVLILVFIGIVYIKNNIYYINPLLNIMGYSFYDIVYLDKNNKKLEKRVFFKGELEIEDNSYKLYTKNKNFLFLEKNKKFKK